jgi:hypothetical protein
MDTSLHRPLTPPDALKKYNKVQMEELSPDAIAAARKRRSRER